MPDSKSVINMVHRIQNRNPGYSDFQNVSQNTNFSNIFSSPVSEGATALKLENEINTESVSDDQQSIASDEVESQNIESQVPINKECVMMVSKRKFRNTMSNLQANSEGILKSDEIIQQNTSSSSSSSSPACTRSSSRLRA